MRNQSPRGFLTDHYNIRRLEHRSPRISYWALLHETTSESNLDFLGLKSLTVLYLSYVIFVSKCVHAIFNWKIYFKPYMLQMYYLSCDEGLLSFFNFEGLSQLMLPNVAEKIGPGTLHFQFEQSFISKCKLMGNSLLCVINNFPQFNLLHMWINILRISSRCFDSFSDFAST